MHTTSIRIIFTHVRQCVNNDPVDVLFITRCWQAPFISEASNCHFRLLCRKIDKIEPLAPNAETSLHALETQW